MNDPSPFLETLLLQRQSCDIVLASTYSLSLATLVLQARSFAIPRDLVVAMTVLRHRPCEPVLSESRNIGVASTIFCNFVVFRAINLVASDLCVGSLRCCRKRSDGSCPLVVVSAVSLVHVQKMMMIFLRPLPTSISNSL